jgi:hypothetical protein
MVLTLLRGLSGKFRHMVPILKLQRPFPTFAAARTYLLLEETDIDARPPSPPAALVAVSNPPPATGQGRQAPTSAPARTGQPGGHIGGPPNGQRNGRRRGKGGRGQGTQPGTGPSGHVGHGAPPGSFQGHGAPGFQGHGGQGGVHPLLCTPLGRLSSDVAIWPPSDGTTSFCRRSTVRHAFRWCPWQHLRHRPRLPVMPQVFIYRH